MNTIRAIMAIALALLPARIASAQASTTGAIAPIVAVPQAAVEARVADLIALANGGGDPAAIFHSDFLKQVPEAQLRAVLTQMAAAGGRALKAQQLDRAGARSATVVIAYERGAATFRLALESVAPYRIVGLLSLGFGATERSLPAVVSALRTLPGMTGFALADLGDQPRITLGYEVDRVLPTGSAFKLVILAELVRAIGAGERHWDDMILLDGRALPAGGYNLKPKGTQVSVRELARQMISVSDNSATDILLTTLGRARVEAMQRTVGVADPKRNRPFLTTLEAFKLKGIATLRAPWLAANERGRRALLAKVDAAPTDALGTLFADGKPVAIDTVEWFMSPADMVRTLDWLRRHTEAGPAAEARAIMAINPGMPPIVSARYAYVGYKGGSEPGVINMTLLLQTKAGGWRAVTAGWANPTAAVDNARFVSLIARAAELAAD